MHGFPHIYRAVARAGAVDEVRLDSPGLPSILSTSPPEFDGPEGYWSPETLLVASVVDCFILTFRAVARASRFDWLELTCEGDGRLEKFNSITRFTEFTLKAVLRVPEGTLRARAELLLQKAENICLITNSLAAEVHLETVIEEMDHQQVA